jgi:hypothetical protein
MERKPTVIMFFCGKFRTVRECGDGGRVIGCLGRFELRGGDFLALQVQMHSDEMETACYCAYLFAVIPRNFAYFRILARFSINPTQKRSFSPQKRKFWLWRVKFRGFSF